MSRPQAFIITQTPETTNSQTEQQMEKHLLFNNELKLSLRVIHTVITV